MTEKLTENDKITKTEAEWKQQLTPEQYQVARGSGTERAFTGQYWNKHDDGPTTASAAAHCFLARKQNLIREPDGRASSPPPTARTSANIPTPAMAWLAPRRVAPAAMRIWATCFRMVPGRPGCATA